MSTNFEYHQIQCIALLKQKLRIANKAIKQIANYNYNTQDPGDPSTICKEALKSIKKVKIIE